MLLNTENISGVFNEIFEESKDSFMSSDYGTTESIVVIGTAFNGPVNSEVIVYSKDHAKYVFGESYDPVSKKEASLVREICDAFDKGNKYVKAVRISGKPIFKDFKFARDTELKLRVSGIFPSNKNKEIYFAIEHKLGTVNVILYKKGERATISEKKSGVVESPENILTYVIPIENLSINKTSSIVDFINAFNNYNINNVIRLGIVDLDGIDVTLSSLEAKEITVADLFPGVYFIGRDENIFNAATEVTNLLVLNDVNKPYEGYDKKLFKKLVLNTDIAAELPIYVEDVMTARKVFGIELVGDNNLFSMVSNKGTVDKMFKKDNVDYEEVNLTPFEIYKRLGSGFAITASASLRQNGDIKVVETPEADKDRIVPITNGIYSMLENSKTKFRALSCAYADQEIKDKIPKKDQFLRASGVSIDLLGGLVKANSLVNEKDLFEPKAYSFEIKALDEFEEPSMSEIYTEKSARSLGSVYTLPSEKEIKMYRPNGLFPKDTILFDSAIPALCRVNKNAWSPLSQEELKLMVDTLFVANNMDSNMTLYKIALVEGVYKPVKLDASGIKEKKYFLVESNETTMLYEHLGTDGVVKPIGEISDVFSDELDKTLIALEDNYGVGNTINISSTAFDFTTVEELVELLNNHPVLKTKFAFEIDKMYYELKDLFVDEFITNKTSFAEGEIGSHNGVIIKALVEFETSAITIDKVEVLNKNIKVYDSSAIYQAGDLVLDATTFSLYMSLEDNNGKELTDILAWSTIYFTYSKLVDYDVNVKIPYKTMDNFARQLAQHCIYTSMKTAPVHGVIGTSPVLSISDDNISKNLDRLCSINYDLYIKRGDGKYILNGDNLPYGVGRKISISNQQYMVNVNGYSYISTGAAGLAALMSALPVNESTTHAKINVTNPMISYTKSQVTKASKAGYVVTMEAEENGAKKIVINDGITMADTSSVFKRYYTAKVMDIVDKTIRDACEPFIGKTNSPATQNSLRTNIKSKVDKLLGICIEAYTFDMLPDTNKKLGKIDVTYKIVPLFELRDVSNNITVTEQL